MIITTQSIRCLAPVLAAAAVCSLFALVAPTTLANEPTYLPALGNTASIDHALSREVSDDFVFKGDSNAVLPPTRLSQAIETIESADAESSDNADSDSSGNVIWDLIRNSDEMPLNDSELVDKYKSLYQEKPYFTNLMLDRSRPYIAHLVMSLDARYLPVELSLLPAIESGFQPHGVSRNNAVGLWQIVPITAREIGIARTRWFDGRADIVTSTVAAIDYLSYLNAEFNGDWELTLAAYNAGPGRVRGAMRKNSEAGLDTNFAALDLPEETRNYVPKFVALVQLIKDSTQTEIVLPDVDTEDAFSVLELDTRISLDQLAKATGVDPGILSELNAGLIFGVTPPEGPHSVYVPKDVAEHVTDVVASANPDELFLAPQTHTVSAGETLGGIALRYGMSMRQLQIINRLDSDRIKIDQKLSVVDSRFLEEPELIPYTVASGDTLSDIAAQFSVNISDVVAESGIPLESDVIRPGDSLKIRVASPNDG